MCGTSFNNFDMSSTGIDVVVNIFFDTHLATEIFKENFKEYNDGYYYTENNELNIDDIDEENDEIISYITRGYSQRDYLKIYINLSKLRYFRNTITIDINELKKKINKISWDVPIYLHIYIKNNKENREFELYSHDLLDDDYKYYKDEVLSKLKNILNDEEFAEVEKLLPEENKLKFI